MVWGAMPETFESVPLFQFPGLLAQLLPGLSDAQTRIRPASGGFAVVEHIWHLSDLEREGFDARITRLLSEDSPQLADFDGARIARERRYLELEPAAGLSAFVARRAANVATFQRLDDRAWTRSGTQEQVGRVTLADLPRMMLSHDRSHAAEIAELLSVVAPQHPIRGALSQIGIVPMVQVA
jgi:hypothetical protein